MSEGKAKNLAPRHKWWGKRPGLFIDNSRFYILVFSFLLSLLVFTYFRIAIVNTTTYLIRVQQIFGFIAIIYWYFALLATPMQTLFGKEGPMKQYLYSRRALGVSAAYFASLHMLLGIFGQLGGFSKLLLLPQRFQLAIVFGAFALLVLLSMAATSFDSVIRWMTFPRWKWLHRVGYLAAILLFFHVWMIGTHLRYEWVRQVMFVLIALFLTLEAWRITVVIQKKTSGKLGWARYVLFVCLAVGFVAALNFVPYKVPNYHTEHVGSGMEH